MASTRPDTTPGLRVTEPIPPLDASAQPGAEGPDGQGPAEPGAASAAPESGGPVGGDRTFDDLYRDEYDPMVRVAFLLVGNAESAEEIVQDAFIKVHLRWSRLDSPGAFLRTCVVNGCRDRIRRRIRLRDRMPRLVSEAAERSVMTDGGDSGPAAELHDVLLQLPLRQRAAIVGRYFGGWDDATIAEAIGVRPTTIRSLVHRGLAALRTEIPR